MPETQKFKVIYLDVWDQTRVRWNILIEPPVQQHVTDCWTHGDQVGTEEGEIVKSGKS